VTEMTANEKANNKMKFVGLVSLSALLSVTTVVFGGIPLLPARRTGGRLAFWAVQIAIALGLALAGLPFYGLVILAQTILVGVYVEVEEHGSSVFSSGTTAILASVGTVALSSGIWLKATKTNFGEALRKQIDPLVEALSTSASNSAVGTAGGTKSVLTTAAVIQQIPSAVVIGLLLSLAIGLIAERRVSIMARLTRVSDGVSAGFHTAKRKALQEFRLPDAFVWIVVFTIAGAFLKHGKPAIELVSVNLLNVLVVLYFFQGLAVISQAFRVFKVSAMWQVIWYVLLVLQLFLMVSLIGFADYWLDFRQRLKAKPAETNRGF
jgi:hypothetical protein